MFVQSLKFVENHAGNAKDISVYGQEGTGTTYKMAKMNLAIRGIPCDLGEKAANTFTNDLHKDLLPTILWQILRSIKKTGARKMNLPTIPAGTVMLFRQQATQTTAGFCTW